MSAGGLPRHHVVVLALLTLCAVARGGYWAVTFETWSPVDEAQHFGYVESLATGHGIPTVGRDRVSNAVMSIAKASPTYFARSRPFSPTAADDNWGAAREQYEGIHGPTYYALMVPAYWIGDAVSPLAALYTVRLASVLLGALAIPLAWLLARRLLPDRPLAWLLGPGLLVCVNGFSATAATVSNDTLIMTGSAAVLLLATRAAASPRWAPAAVTGAAAGAVFVGKTTALGLFPLVAIVAFVQHRNGLATTNHWVRRIVAAGVGAAAFTLPWIAWNLVIYKAISGASAVDAITGSLQTVLEPGLHALHRHWEGARVTFWEAGLLTGEASYRRTWDVLTVVLGSVGLIAALRRWRRPEAMTVAALGLSFPVAFAAMVGFFFYVLGGSGVLLGRYVYVALVPLLLGLGAAALAVAGPRWATTFVLAIASFALWQEIDLTDHYLTATYELTTAYGGTAIDRALAPVIDQTWNDGLVSAKAVVLDATCPVEVIQVGLERPPATLRVRSTNGIVGATRDATFRTGFTTYKLATPAIGVLSFDVPTGSGVAASAGEREPAASLEGASQDPLVRAWCRLGRPRATEVRFERAYDPQHPPFTRGELRAWPRAWFAAGLALTLAAAFRALVGDRRPRTP